MVMLVIGSELETKTFPVDGSTEIVLGRVKVSVM
jgi:hypothetical protein